MPSYPQILFSQLLSLRQFLRSSSNKMTYKLKPLITQLCTKETTCTSQLILVRLLNLG